MGLLLILALLIVSWFLRACAPVAPSTSLTMLETPTPPPPEEPPRSRADPESLARRRRGRRRGPARPSSPRSRPTSGQKVALCKRDRAAEAGRAAEAAAGRQGAARHLRLPAPLRGRPVGAEGSRHAAGLLAARPGHREAASAVGGRSERVRREGGPHLLRRQRRRLSAPSTARVLGPPAPSPARRPSPPASATTQTLGATQPAVRCNRGRRTGPAPQQPDLPARQRTACGMAELKLEFGNSSIGLRRARRRTDDAELLQEVERRLCPNFRPDGRRRAPHEEARSAA